MQDDVVTVLLIEDEPQIRRLVRNALHSDPTFLRLGLDETDRTPELRVSEAGTGQEGIDLAAGEAPALVILDLGLPDMEGIAAAREIRRWSSAPIIVLSARHTDTEKAALLDAGADDYVTKPFSTLEFIADRARLAEALALFLADSAAKSDRSTSLQISTARGIPSRDPHRSRERDVSQGNIDRSDGRKHATESVIAR